MKRNVFIGIIIAGGVAAFFGMFFLTTGIAVLPYDSDAGNKDTLLGVIFGILGLVGIFGGIAGKRKANSESPATAKENAYQKALEKINPDVLSELKKERDQGMITEEQFRELVIAKRWQK